MILPHTTLPFKLLIIMMDGNIPHQLSTLMMETGRDSILLLAQHRKDLLELIFIQTECIQMDAEMDTVMLASEYLQIAN
jgi:hypothetical protein